MHNKQTDNLAFGEKGPGKEVDGKGRMVKRADKFEVGYRAYSGAQVVI